MLAIGKSALEKLKLFRARKWYQKEFQNFASRVSQEYSERSEVAKGCQIDLGGSASTRYSLFVDCDAVLTGSTIGGHVMLKGKLHNIAKVVDKDLANAAGDVASLAIALSDVPTITANSGTHGNLTISSGGNVAVIRFYNSDAGSPTGYNAEDAADFAGQIDTGLNGATKTNIAAKMKTALATVFTPALGYTISGTNTITITAPAGYGYDFDYIEEANMANIGDTKTPAVKLVGGMIYSDGLPASGIDTDAAAEAYVSIIATNSDNNGGVAAEGTEVFIMAVVNGSSGSLTAEHCSSDGIQAALNASSGNTNGYNHSGATGWVHLARATWNNSTKALTSNLNNHLGA